MPAPVPLPPPWTLYTTVHCPSCTFNFHFYPNQGTSLERDIYCPNENCPQYGYVYTIELRLDGCQVKAARKADGR